MPKSKKDSTSDSDSGPDDRTPAKKSKPEKKEKKPAPEKKEKPAPAESSTAKTGKGESECWTLEKLRRATINEFRGRKSVDIREYYEKDGNILPGKKGICLTPIQWHKLMEYKDEITEALKNQ